MKTGDGGDRACTYKSSSELLQHFLYYLYLQTLIYQRTARFLYSTDNTLEVQHIP